MAFIRLLTSALLTLASSAFAITNDPFTVLRSEFNSADHAVISDYPKVYDLNTPRTAMKCRFVCYGGTCQNRGRLVPGLVGQFDKFIPGSPGTPGNGPLFPGEPATPDQTVSMLSPVFLIQDENATVTNDYIIRYNSNVRLETKTRSNGELISELSYYDQNGFLFRSTTTYRKKAAQLFVREINTSGIEAYGYCY